jgi:hypothetical protein
MAVLLTSDERAAIEKAASLWNDLCRIVRDLDDLGVPRGEPGADQHIASRDLDELIVHVHAIQHAIMANAAARAYPDQLRRLGARIPERP